MSASPEFPEGPRLPWPEGSSRSSWQSVMTTRVAEAATQVIKNKDAAYRGIVEVINSEFDSLTADFEARDITPPPHVPLLKRVKRWQRHDGTTFLGVLRGFRGEVNMGADV